MSTVVNQDPYWVQLKPKGTVREILGDPPCKAGNARFTMIPLKPLFEQ